MSNTEDEICVDIDAVLAALTARFDYDWRTRPTTATCSVTDAEYFWLCGRRAGREAMLSEDVAEMGRLVQARRNDNGR